MNAPSPRSPPAADPSAANPGTAPASPESLQPQVAQPPFNQPSADLVLRTSDRVDFHVHGPILSQASPVFESMLSLPQPPRGGDGEAFQRPIVDVTEDSKTLDRLLRLCYPILKPDMASFEDIVPTLEAAIKYDMEYPIALLKGNLLSLVSARPLRVWSVACCTKLKDVGDRAVSEIVGRAQPPTNAALDVLRAMIQEEGTGVFDGVCAGDYYRLRESLCRTFFADITTTISALPWLSFTGNTRVYQPFLSQTTPPDIVLRCADGVRFQAHRLVLSIHSPVLSLKIHALSSPINASHSTNNFSADPSIPALSLSIHSTTMSLLLRVCYEGEDCLPTGLSSLAALLSTADKFKMRQIVKMVRRQWDAQSSCLPFEAYFVAVKYGLDTALVKAAARNVVNAPIAGRYVLVMEDVAALAYHRLVEYYHACALAISVLVEERTIPAWKVQNSCVDTSWMESYLRNLIKQANSNGPGSVVKGFTAHALLDAPLSSTIWPNVNLIQPSQRVAVVKAILRLASSWLDEVNQAIGTVRTHLIYPHAHTVYQRPLAFNQVSFGS